MANGRSNFNWSEERWQRINNLVHDEAAKVRVARRVIPLFGDSNGYVDNLPNHMVKCESEGLEILPTNPPLVPVELSIRFKLYPEQFNNEQVARALATRAAYHLALAEDIVVLHGSANETELQKLKVKARNLDQQGSLLKSETTGGSTTDAQILKEISEGIERLRKANHYGEYCAIVAPDLYGKAVEEKKIIDHIRSLLREDGFLYSSALETGTGVIFSLGGHTIDMAVPVDVTVEFDKEESGMVLLRVVEQFRLRINDSSAIVVIHTK